MRHHRRGTTRVEIVWRNMMVLLLMIASLSGIVGFMLQS